MPLKLMTVDDSRTIRRIVTTYAKDLATRCRDHRGGEWPGVPRQVQGGPSRHHHLGRQHARHDRRGVPAALASGTRAPSRSRL